MSFLYSGSLRRSLYCGFSLLCVGLYRWLVKVSWLGKLVSVFWWVELYFFSLFSRASFEELDCFSGCLMSSAGIQKLFCGIYSMFKCSFDEFVEEKVFSPSYFSAILAPSLQFIFFKITIIRFSIPTVISYFIQVSDQMAPHLRGLLWLP